ncbi:hypothetical protein HYPSUDRAFT_126725, partial [Hypholoma sublateritium FD-334 SS-4]
VSFVQAWYYFMKYQQDVWYIKALVGSIWFFETIHQALISHTVYHYIITNYNNPHTLDDIVWSILLEVLFNGLIGLLVQGFLTLRVWRLSGKNTSLTLLIVRANYSNNFRPHELTDCRMQLKTWVELEQLKGLSMAVNLLGAITDVIIAVALFLFLHRSRTGFKKSDTMISKLILASGHTLIYVSFYFCLGRLYSNSVLATLNARQIIRDLGENSDELSFSLQALSKSGERNHNSARSTNISIKIDTVQDFLRSPHHDHNDPVLSVQLGEVSVSTRNL